MGNINADAIPGFREALERERVVREHAFLGACEPIEGVSVVPLTLERLHVLMVARNCFVAKEPFKVGDVLQFLWVASPGWSYSKTDRDAFIAKYAEHVFTHFHQCVEGIKSMVTDTFMDVDRDGESGKISEPLTAWVAYYVLMAARETGWSRNTIFKDIPFTELIQYLRIADKLRGGTVNNPTSTAAKMAWLETLNRRGDN